MSTDAITSDRPAAAPATLRAEPQEKAPAEQRIADAAAKRPAPVDQAQVSPQARQLESGEKPADESREQQRSDEKQQPARLQAQQQQGQAAQQKRFEVVA